MKFPHCVIITYPGVDSNDAVLDGVDTFDVDKSDLEVLGVLEVEGDSVFEIAASEVGFDGVLDSSVG